MKLKLPLFTAIVILFSFLPAQAQTGPKSWKRYMVPGQEVSVALPTVPAMTTMIIDSTESDNERREISLGVYADGTIYTVHIRENLKRQQSLADFIAEETAGWGPEDDTKRDLTVRGVRGREYSRALSTSQFFARQQRFYTFTVIAGAADDPSVKRFFSSIAFGNKQEGIALSDGPGTPYHTDTDEKIFTGKEVDQKPRLAQKVDPQYTEEARRNQEHGTVVLRVVFTSGGNVSNIRVVSGLLHGLTERAIDAARKIKFIPAMKDGHNVSMWMQLEYNFNLY
jgi:TonB family protein